ncbi:thiamine pyrophosphate transporter [Schizosaccharomyces cryophilus OY26]|uniref:Thiamine pyrophosphate transporter n=1 Tax=Schizosaccharomyces cryophilus (strain OY26 / ATCC MYA-4695 / CBS 11777 / NBRC 106824 / NRRL Y48691) TaxID=653667 RepID=S9X8U2_SCHCR|nr:thiamine pyrophosphate transporter [Schizosaccharomyces cryophilus OY26]EPY53602.1 thiamine pyrophosphate transporter [Schizosaccharomyces cryophilus OY26]
MAKSDATEFHQPAWHYTFAGGLASVICRFTIAPFDVLKIRMQVSHSSLLQVLKTTLHNEGYRALWRGNVSAELLYLIYGSTEFVVFSKSRAFTENLQANKHILNFLSGAFAGSCATVVSYPFDTLRTQFATSKKSPRFMDTIKNILRSQGIQGFFPGLKASLYQIGPHVGLFFMAYKSIYASMSPLGIAASSSLSGVLAGVTTKAMLFPVDTVVKNMQVSIVRQSSFVQCFNTILRDSGARGFYRGLPISIAKVAPGRAITMLIYEETLRTLNTVSSET